MKTSKRHWVIFASVLGFFALSFPAYSKIGQTQIKTTAAIGLENTADPYEDLTREIKDAEERAETAVGEKRTDAAFKLNELKWREANIRRYFDGAKYKELVEDANNSVR